jgi:hypothetical protein
MPPADTCEGIEAEYARLIISNRSCAGPQDCQVLDGQCGVGLGGCYEAVNMSVSQDELGQMGRRYNVIGCTEAVCDCAPPPSPDCQQGVCVFGR